MRQCQLIVIASVKQAISHELHAERERWVVAPDAL